MSSAPAPPPSSRPTDRRSGAAALLTGLVGAAVVGAVALLLLGGDPADEAAIGNRAIERSTDAEADGADDQATGRSGGSTTTAVTRTTTGPATTAGNTTDTVEADETTADPIDEDPTADGDRGDDDATGGDTVPTVPPPTTGTCRITVDRLDGQSGVVELGRDGACGALGATIQAVNPRDDLAGIDWGRDIRVCQRHPAAAEVGVVLTTAAETVRLTAGFSRSAQDAGADPVQAISITFDDQDTPLTGPRPVALCRTDEAEVSIVHRPPS